MRWLATIALPSRRTAEVGRRRRLSGVRAQRHQIGGERPVGPHQRFDRHRRRDVRRAQQHVEVGDGEDEHPEHAVGAVDQRQTLLGLQRDRGDAGGGGRRGALAFADQGESDVGEWGEVATRAERPVLRNGRGDPGVEQVDDALDDDGADSRVTQRQRPGPQQHHRPDHLVLDRRAHPGGVRADQRALQLLAALGGDHRGGERPEPGGHAVDGLGGTGVGGDEPGAGFERRPRLRADGDLAVAAGDLDDGSPVESVRRQDHDRLVHWCSITVVSDSQQLRPMAVFMSFRSGKHPSVAFDA